MRVDELRQKYLEFFKTKGHAVIPSASLIPENDPTALFNSAGMQPLVPYLMGERHPEGKKLVDIQKCVRTTDIDEVGDSVHHSFFEMLGNWSLGDYFKKEAIEWSWEFLTSAKWLDLPKEKIAVSVFAGDENSSFDEEAFNHWQNLGLPAARIAKLSKKDNWWGPAGETGPCGPSTEMFYWIGVETAPEKFVPEDVRWIEIWNDVFMEFNKLGSGKFEKLSQKNVDTGMGLERALTVINNLNDNYKTELFSPIISKIEELSAKKYGEDPPTTQAMRVIADHLRAATFIMGDEKGISPSNVDQGYVLRRFIRRSIRYGKQLNINKLFTHFIAEEIIKLMQDEYNELKKNKNFIIEQLVQEEEKFSWTLARGLKEFQNIAKRSPRGISSRDAFNLYQSYGFPIEMTQELAQEKNLAVDEKGFQEAFKKHQELSRTASVGKFKGGLADASEETKKLHTAAHLMLAGLRQILGDQVEQKGANITPQRLRFDFSHGQKLTTEQKQALENFVNQAIKQKLPVNFQEMTLTEAKKQSAIGVFDAKYGQKVKVYTIGKGDNIISQEICGGPHVVNTAELGQKFHITTEQSSSAGVRRIKATLE